MGSCHAVPGPAAPLPSVLSECPSWCVQQAVSSRGAHGPPLLHPSPKHAHSLPDLLLAAARVQHSRTPQRLCSCGFLTWRVFLQPPPTSHLLCFRPLLHTQPKSFGVNQPWFYALFCPLPVCTCPTWAGCLTSLSLSFPVSKWGCTKPCLMR